LYPQAIPQYNLGYERFRNLMAAMETESPGLFLAGHYRDGISVSDCIVSGEKVAGRLANYLAAAPLERVASPMENPAWAAA
jgi:oxygen-dependent protoporphyrinogen oxidase